MNKLILFFVFLFGGSILNAQFDIMIRGGGLVDMYRIKQSQDDGVFAPWTKNFVKGKPWDYPYLNVELAYSLNDKNTIGLRYHFEEFNDQVCFNASYDGIECGQSSNDDLLKISGIYKRLIPLINRFSVHPSIGIGISFSYYDVYYNDYSKLTGTGEGIIGDLYYEEYNYQDHKVIPFIPLELNLSFKYNKFLNFELNFGYNQYLRKSVVRTEIFYKVGDSDRHATIYTSNNMYLGLGIGYHIDFKRKMN